MKKVYALVVVSFLFFVFSKSLAQVSTNGASGMLASYGSLAGALSDLNAIGTVTANVVITLEDNETAPVGGYTITATGTAGATITINGAAFTITAAQQTGGSTNDAVFKIIGSDYLTLRDFIITENALNSVTAIASNTMTEFGIALYGASATNGAQNNTIQNNSITLNNTYTTSIGIMSTCSFVSTTTTGGNPPAAQTATAGGENSNNKYYGNTISNVAFGMMVVTPPATATFRETGTEIGGATAATGNTINYGNSAATIGVTYPNAQTAAASLGGIVVTNSLGVTIRNNTVTSTPIFSIATNGIVLGWTGTTPAGFTFTNTISNNTVTVNTSAFTAATNTNGIEFGYGLNAGGNSATLTASNNNVTINQTPLGAATNTTVISGIRAPYTSSAVNVTGNTVNINQTHTFNAIVASPLNGIVSAVSSVAILTLNITGNNITFDQSLQNTTAASITSAITGILAGANSSNINTANINFNNITVKQAATSSGTFGGVGNISYISMVGTLANQAAFSNLNINSNNLNTLGSTILSTSTVTGIAHDFTNVVTLSIASNSINFDRTGAGSTYGTFSSNYTAAAAVTSTVSGNNVSFSGSMAGSITEVIGFNEREGDSAMIKNITLDTITMNLPNLTGGNHIGVNFQAGARPLGYLKTGSVANCTFSIITGGTPVGGVQISGGGSGGILTNINNNSFNLSTSSNSATPSINAVNINGGTRSRIFNNDFNSLAIPNVATGAPTIRAVFLQQGGVNVNFPHEIFNNTVSNVFTFAGSGNSTVEGIGIPAACLFVNVYKNKIYGLSASTSGSGSVVTGIRTNTPGTAGGIINISNNYIGFDNSANPNTSNTDVVRGISFFGNGAASTLNVFHNTIYLAAAPAATVTNFGTTGLYHTTSGTAANGNLVLRNNIIVNVSTPKGTGKTVAFRRNSALAATNNYNSASNNNLFYAGTPGVNNVIYSDGAASFYQTLSNYQAVANLAPRDNVSVTEMPPFLSTLGSSPDFLNINPSVGTVVESAGGVGTGVTDDNDNPTDTRCPGGGCPGGSATPDIGADELAGTCPVPAAPTNLVLTGTNPYSGSFTGAIPSPTGGYIVFRTIVNTQPSPVTGANYNVGTTYTIGVSATVVAKGTATTFSPDNATGGPPYYYWVFSYNTGCGASPNYSSATANAIAANCTAPAQPTLLNLTAVSSSQINGSFTGSGASGYLVVRTKTAASPTSASFPQNGVPYTAGQVIAAPNDTVVVYSGSGTTFSATGLNGGTTYYFWVYPYNTGCIGTPFYNTTSPLNGSVASLPCLAPGTYTIGPAGDGANFRSIGEVITALQCYNTSASPQSGVFTFEFTANYASSVESFPLLIPGIRSTNTASVTFRPQTGVTGRSITSANTVGTLLFQGELAGRTPSYFIFDGRPGGVGTARELTIENTNVGSSYAIQFENGADSNVVQYCNIKSNHNGTSGGGGTIIFGSSAFAGIGNSKNTIQNNDIFQSSATPTITPTNAIYSNGISSAANDTNTIANNNIYNFFNAGYTCAGVHLAAFSRRWTISGNRFYQTFSRTFSSSTATYNAILAATNTTGDITISNNIIGYSSATGTGFTTIGGNGILRTIQLTTNNTNPSLVANNTITNIAFTSSNSSSAHSLISLAGGVDTVRNNTLGSQITTNTITVNLTDNTAGLNFAGISTTSSTTGDVYVIRNNTIGGINILGTSTSAGIQGINFSGSVATHTIIGNTIGSPTVANSFSNSLNTTLTGIIGSSSISSVTQTVSGNTISNLSATNTGTNSYATGISVSGIGRYSIGDAFYGGNTIYNLNSAGSNTVNNNASGIINLATTNNQTIFGNLIYSINSTAATADVGVIGIYNAATGTGNIVESNQVHSLNIASSNTGSSITGIQAQTGTASYYNNMIRLGITSTGASISTAYGIYGLVENGGSLNSFYMNSVYVGGTGVGAGSDSYAFFGANTTSQDIRNNIFWNARSNTSAAVPNHYAISLASNVISGVRDIDFNDIVATGTGKILGFYGSQQLTLANWRSATLRDNNSFSSLPGYINPTGATPDLHINPASNTVVEAGGTALLTPGLDIDGSTRSLVALTPVDLGADAFVVVPTPVKIDGSITALVAPTSAFACFTSTEQVTVTFRNLAGGIDFSVTPVTITVNVSGPAAATLTATINTGTLAAGASLDVPLSPTLNMTSVGTYTFACSFTVGGTGVDKDITNNEFSDTRVNAPFSVGTASSSPGNFCGVSSGTPTLTLTGAGGGAIQWYESTAIGGPYVGVGSGAATYTPSTPINTTHYYYATVSCGSTLTSNIVSVGISSPVITSTPANQSSCGPSTFTFSAGVSGSPTTVARWYDASTGALAFTGSPFNTPLLSATTTYNLRAVDTSSTPVTATFGTGSNTNTTTGYPSPYTNWYGGTKHQMLIRASELTAAGVTAGDITAVTFYVASIGSTFSGSLSNFTIYMGSTASTALTSTFLPVDPTPVYSSASQPVVVGANTHTFTSNFAWDGVSNVIVQTSYSNGNFGGASDNVQMYYTPTLFNSMNYYRQDLATAAAILGATTGNGTSPTPPSVNRPNMMLRYKPFCTSAASPVTATVNPSPTPVTILSTTRSISSVSADTITLCGDSAMLFVSGGTTTQNNSVTASSTVNAAILDFSGGTPSNLTSGISVALPNGATIDSIRVNINLSHTFDGDLNLHLTSPNGQTVNLINRRGGFGQNMVNTQISSSVSNASMGASAAPFTGLFRADLATVTNTIPATTTNTFSNLFVTGTGALQSWTISVHDMAAIDVGTLQSWGITIFYKENIAVPYVWRPNTPASYNMFTNPGLSSLYTNQNINTVFVKPTVDTSYIVEATLGSCTKKDTVRVKVFNTSTAATGGNITPAAACSGANFTLTQTGGVLGTGAVWGWYSDAGYTTLVGTSSAPNASLVVTPAATTTYYLRAQGGSAPCAANVATGVSVTAVVSPANQWLGVNTNWNDPVNWCPGLPGATSDVTIPGALTNYPLITATGPLARNITIAAGANITLTGAGTLEIKGLLTNNGTLNNWGEIILSGTTAQTFPGTTGTINAMSKLSVNNAAGVTINRDLLIRDAITATNGTVTLNNVYVTLRSVVDSTARIGQVGAGAAFSYTGTGNFVVERYFPGRRAWRLISSPLVTTSAKSIFSAWQSGGNNLSPANDNNGTYVTGPSPNLATNGLDVSNTNNFSMRRFDPATSGFNAAFSGVSNTRASRISYLPASGNINYTDTTGYFMFVRGDRTTNNPQPFNQYITGNATTLRDTGLVRTGSVTVNCNPTTVTNIYTLIGNPYASAVDFTLLTRSTSVKNSFRAWDPTIGSVGGWVVRDYTTVPAGANTPSSTNVTDIIQSKQAFVVETIGAAPVPTVTFTESAKSSFVEQSLLFRPTPTPQASLRADLYFVKDDGMNQLSDGVLVQFNNDYSAANDHMDAVKFTNLNETFSIKNGNNFYSIERRPFLGHSDTLFFNFTRTRQFIYKLKLDVNNIIRNGNRVAYLNDRYEGTATALNMLGNTWYEFKVTSDAGSAAANRFFITFRRVAKFKSITAEAIQSDVTVKWDVEEADLIDAYEVERSVDGEHFVKAGEISAAAKDLVLNTYALTDMNLQPGYYYYRVKAISNSHGASDYSEAVKVKVVRSSKNMYVYPNPVTNGTIGLRMPGAAPEGRYSIRLLDGNGKAVALQQVQHMSTTGTERIQYPVYVAAGNYQLEVTAPDKKKTVISVIIQKQ